MKTRILYLFDTLNVGGAEISLLEMIRRFKRTEAVVCSLYPGAALAPAFRNAGAKVVQGSLAGKNSFQAAVRCVVELVKRERPHILQTALFRAGIAGRLAAPRLGIPVIDTLVNDSYAADRWRDMRGFQRMKLAAVWLMDVATARRPTMFLANSHSVAEANMRRLCIPAERVRVIHRGRDPAAYAGGSSGQRVSTRNSLGVAEGAVVLLAVGRLLRRKGQSDLLEAVAGLVQEKSEIILLVAGDGSCRTDLESQARWLGIEGNVKFLGTRQDIPRLLQACDFFVFPSHYEGCPGALVEAMLAAKPIVATDIPPNREVLGGSENAILVPKGSPRELIIALRALAKDQVRASELGISARNRASSIFDIDRIASAHEELYEATLGGA